MFIKAALCLLNVGIALAAPTPAATTSSSASARTSAPSGALVVGSSATYTKIQDAVDALSTSSTTAQSIFIEAGTYSEQVYIPAREAELTIYGYTTDTSSYSENTVTITAAVGLDTADDDDATGTLRVWSENFKMYNINVENTRGEGSQALAVSAYATNQGYYACQFLGYQDTILAQTGYQLYAKSYIEGATDFIFGQHGQAWFSYCDIGVLDASLGYVTASGRPDSDDDSYYVLDHCSIAAKSGASVTSGAYYLGRPWADYARVAVQETSMTDVINSAGWSEWSTSEPQTDHVTFAEYDNSGDGSEGTRASFASTLSAALDITDILGSDYSSASYVDTTYL